MSAPLRLAETRKEGGWAEIGAYAADGSLRAVVTHPMTGADWFVYWSGSQPRSRFKTRKAALEAVTNAP